MVASSVDANVRAQLIRSQEDLLTAVGTGESAVVAFQKQWLTLQTTIMQGIASQELTHSTMQLAHIVANNVQHIAQSFLTLAQVGTQLSAQHDEDLRNIMQAHTSPGATNPPNPPISSICQPNFPDLPKSDSPSTTRQRNASVPPKTAHNGFSEWVPIRDWFLSNIAEPYPSNTEKKSLIEGTSITLNQFNAWLNNLRRRCRWTEICRKYAGGQRPVMKDLCKRVFVQSDPTRVVEESVRQELLAMRESVYQLYRQDKSDWWSTVVKMVSDVPEGLVEEAECEDNEETAIAHDMRKRERREERERRRTQRAMRRAIMEARQKERLQDVRIPISGSSPEVFKASKAHGIPSQEQGKGIKRNVTERTNPDHELSDTGKSQSVRKRKRVDETNLPITPPPMNKNRQLSHPRHRRYPSEKGSAYIFSEDGVPGLVPNDIEDRPSKRTCSESKDLGNYTPLRIDPCPVDQVDGNQTLDIIYLASKHPDASTPSLSSKRKRDDDDDVPPSVIDVQPTSKEADLLMFSRPTKRLRQDISLALSEPSPASRSPSSSYSVSTSSPTSVASSLPSLSRSSSGNFTGSPDIDNSRPLPQEDSIWPSFTEELSSLIHPGEDQLLLTPTAATSMAMAENKEPIASLIVTPGAQELLSSDDAMAALFALDWTVPSPPFVPTLLPDSTSLGRLGLDFEFSDILDAVCPTHPSSVKQDHERPQPRPGKSKEKRRVVIEIDDSSADELDAFDWLSEKIPNILPDEDKGETSTCNDDKQCSRVFSTPSIIQASTFTPEELRYLLTVATSGSDLDSGVFPSGNRSESDIFSISGFSNGPGASARAPTSGRWKKVTKRKASFMSCLTQGDKTSDESRFHVPTKNGEGFGGNVTNDSTWLDDARKLQAEIVHKQISHHQSRLAALESQAKELGLEI